jgi:hypothetical protein
VSRRKKDIQPFWRPNFVNQSELPDIKVIRTDFIINFIAVAVALSAAFFLFQREYRAYTLGQTVAEMEQRIRIANSDDVEYLKLSQSFRDSAQYVVDIENFLDSPFQVHELLHGLSGIKPDDLIFKSISFTESVAPKNRQSALSYAIDISGDAKNLTVLDEFKQVLEGATVLEIPGFDLRIGESLQGRDEETGIFPYSLAISLTPSKKDAPKKSAEEDAS